MKQFQIKAFTDKEIILDEADQVVELYESLQKDEAIQFVWIDNTIKKSQIIISGNIAGKVRLGEIMIKSEQASMRT